MRVHGSKRIRTVFVAAAIGSSVVVSLGPLGARGQCVDYGDYLHWVGDLPTPGEAYDVATSGSHAFVAGGVSGLQIVDLSDPSSPEIVGEVDTPGRAYGVAVSRGLAFVADGDSGLLIVDVSIPAPPWVKIVASVPTPGEARKVASSGSQVYVAGDSLAVVEVSEPSVPILAGSVALPDDASCVTPVGDHVYVTCGISSSSRLHVVDVSDPWSPSLLGSVETPNSARGVAVSGSHAFVGTSGGYGFTGSLEVIDVSDPDSLVIVGSIEMPDNAEGVAVSGNRAYVAAGGGLQLIDIGDPLLPRIVGSVDLSGGPLALAVEGGHAYLVGQGVSGVWWGYGHGLRVIDIANHDSPPMLGSVATPNPLADVAVVGDYAYAIGGGFHVIDVTDLSSPQVVGTGPGVEGKLTMADGRLYVAGDSLHVIDVSAPGSPAVVGTVDLPGTWASDVAAAGPYVCTVGYPFLQVIDVGDPTSPQPRGTVDWGGPWGRVATNVAVAGDHAFVRGRQCTCTSCTGYLWVFDLSDPDSPENVATIGGWFGPLSSDPGDVVIAGDCAYVAGSNLQVWGIEDPSSPEYLATVPLDDSRTIEIAGNCAYVATARGVHAIDVGNPPTPRPVGNLRASGRLAATGEAVFVATATGLEIYPAHCMQTVPVLLSGFTAEPEDRAVLLSWFTSFEHLHDGFNVYRSRRIDSGYARLNDRLIRGRGPWSYLDRDVRPSTTYWYRLGDVGLDGREVLHDPTTVTTPAWGLGTALHSASPNPFRRETALRFTLSAPSKAKVAVYDVAGRLVRTVVDEVLPEGDHAASWDGRGRGGTRVAGGAYFVKLTAGEVERTRKVLFLGGK